tara:strand:+ start:452 stop:685 length:234 start_codon:yes stop_codon:yes gene_type:complete
MYTEAARLNEYGKYYYVELVWRGRPYRVQIFFPKLNKPQRQDIQKQAGKIYPGARIISYVEASRSNDLPMLFAIDYF